MILMADKKKAKASVKKASSYSVSDGKVERTKPEIGRAHV